MFLPFTKNHPYFVCNSTNYTRVTNFVLTVRIFPFQPKSRSESLASVYSSVGEGRFGAVAVQGEVRVALQYNYKEGQLECHIIKARELAPVDTKRNRSDPWVEFHFLRYLLTQHTLPLPLSCHWTRHFLIIPDALLYLTKIFLKQIKDRSKMTQKYESYNQTLAVMIGN